METPKLKKFRIDNPISWETHRGGWSYVLDIIQSELHTSDGTLFISAIEDVMMKKKPINEPWTGFVHQVPRNNLERFLDLERLLGNKTWIESLPYCRGIFTISNYLKSYLEAKGLPIPINWVPYAIDFQFQEFNYHNFIKRPRKVVFIGEFMRNFQAFFDLDAGDYQKLLLVTESFSQANVSLLPNVTLLERLSDSDYDQMLSESVVFLNLFDAPANTTVVECLGRSTPLLINKLPGVVDYLGEDYPFYYSTLDEASKKLADDNLIEETWRHLMESEVKKKLRRDYFVNAIRNGSIYRSLPIPRSQRKAEFEQYDVTIVITSYKRVYNMDALLNCFCMQEFEGSFEVIVWNNNMETSDQLEILYEKYKHRLKIRLIHSSENYYCAMRLAMAHLMQSEHLLICDDDVVPGPGYIQAFWNKFLAHGPEVVLCARGHAFELHELDKENPEKVWKSRKHLKFYDESIDDTEIHFFHADNCFIPKSILEKVNAFEWENLDFILVDDYWMSYIVSNELRIPILKIQLNKQMHFTPCADSKEIALFYNPNVRKERINFYIYHMERDWPNSIIGLSSEVAASKKSAGLIKTNVIQNPALSISDINVKKLNSTFFKAYDVSVVICTHSCLHNLLNLIESFKGQDFLGSFELVIWNNNYANVEELNKLYAEYKGSLEIKIIHSTQNYSLKPRIALTSLLRGSKIVFCDEDVLPKHNYLSHLVKKYTEFRANGVICVSGESVLRNDMDEDLSYLEWEGREVKTHGIEEDECMVNLLRGSTCIISRDLMKKASTFGIPEVETTLVFDYWLSYIFSYELKVNIVKIKGDCIMSFAQHAPEQNKPKLIK